MASHVGFSMIGYLTLPWVMTSELYPLKFRGIFGGLTTSIAQILTFAAVKTYPDMNSILGLEATMWIFSAAGLLGKNKNSNLEKYILNILENYIFNTIPF